MHRVRSLVSTAIAILAGAIAGCSDDSPPSTSTTQQTYRGVFVSTQESGSVSLTLTSPPSARNPLLARLGHNQGRVSGVISFDGVASHPLSGTYDATKDTITFTGGGYTFSGPLESDFLPERLVGRIYGSRPGSISGILQGVRDDGTVVAHLGKWSWSPDRYLAPVGFLTKGKDVVGSMIFLYSVWPYYGYDVTGTMGEGNPLRPLTASGGNAAQTTVFTGFVDTVIDTAGGSWENTPFSNGTIVSGWWHTTAVSPYGVAAAHKRLP